MLWMNHSAIGRNLVLSAAAALALPMALLWRTESRGGTHAAGCADCETTGWNDQEHHRQRDRTHDRCEWKHHGDGARERENGSRGTGPNEPARRGSDGTG